MANEASSGETKGDGTGIRVQVRPLSAGGAKPQSVESTVRELGDKQLQLIGELIRKIHSQISASFAELTPKPTGVSLEFGIDAEGEVGIPFVTKGSIGANFKVTVEWK